MRLLDVYFGRLREFSGAFHVDIPEYAILSHTWGERELQYSEFARSPAAAFRNPKVAGCCAQARRDGYKWVWIDTCCIDKSSSSELSEAINSMYQWYHEAKVCYAYLTDVPAGDRVFDKASAFRRSRWFTRGCTLQELLAPTTVAFSTSSGVSSGSSQPSPDLGRYITK